MTTGPSQAYANEYLQAAEETLEEARTLLTHSLAKGTVNRVYYAMFYAACAALLSVNVGLPKRHRTIMSLLHQHFVRKGRLPQVLHQDLVESYKLRQQSDYEISTVIGIDELQTIVDRAEAFVAEVKRIVTKEVS